MTNRAKYDKKTIRNAILASGGIKKNVYDALGCSRQTLDNYLKKFTDLDALLKDQSEELLDIAENHLKKWIEQGEPEAVYFVLKTKGRTRGYTTRNEVTGANDGAPLVFNIIPVD